jgi:hypothetical protein
MSKNTLPVTGVASRVRAYARGLGVEDESAISMALRRFDDRLASGRSSGAAFEEACGLLASWRRHPSNECRW